VKDAVAVLPGLSQVNAVNNHDQMVGARSCGGRMHAVMLENGEAHDILAGVDDLFSSASHINDAGMVVGSVSFTWDPNGTYPTVPFIWYQGETTVLHTLPESRPVAINNQGQVLLLGQDSLLGGFLWEDGVLTEFGPSMLLLDINDLGQVVGQLIKEPTDKVGFLWQDGMLTELPLLKSANAINDSGQIAGISRDGTVVVMDGEDIVDLNVPAHRAPIAIAADGAVLGSDYLWIGGVLSELSGKVNRNTFESVDANGMNDRHVVVGRGDILTFVQVPGGCRLEACEKWTGHATVWSDDCFGGCCGDPDGAGGAGGAGGRGTSD
jgi:uncharacterized membrane protein